MPDRPDRHARSAVGVMRGVGYEITDADDAFLAIVGYARSDFAALRLNWRDMTPPEYLHLDEAGIRQARASGGFTVPYQKEFVRKDGTRVPVLLACAFLPDEPGAWMGYVVDLSSAAGGGAPAALAGARLDAPLPIDAYVQLVRELARERARTVALLDGTDALIWAVDPQLRLLSANLAFQEAQRAVTGRIMEVGDDAVGPEFPEWQRQEWLAAYGRALGGERFTLRGELRADGIERWFESAFTPMLDPRGAVIGVSVVSQDVTARTVAERALRESEARFRTLTAAAPVGVLLADATGACVYANPRLEATWRRPAAALLGGGWLAGVHAADAAAVAERWAAAVRDVVAIECDFRVVAGDGELRTVRLRTAPVLEGGRVTSFVATVDDETERHALAARARQREKMESLGTLAGGIAHDFNNILGAVLGFADLALEGARDEAELHDMLREIRTASLRARDLVRQILAFSRHSEQERGPVELRALVRESARLLRATLPSSVALDVRLPDDDAWVLADGTALQQVLLNLAMNGEHAMRGRRGGLLTIVLEVERAGPAPAAMLRVHDTGSGIPREVRERMFEPFFTTKPIGEGTGMGLAVVHGIVSAHQGSIHVDSVPGEGTEVCVSLPLAEAPPATAPAPVRPAAAGGYVLLVEDEAPLARFAERALRQAGFEVRTCRDGSEALEAAFAGGARPDVVVSDVTMPGLSGDRLALELRARCPAIPVLLMTGFSAVVTPESASALGATRLLQKPFSAAELVGAVAETLARR